MKAKTLLPPPKLARRVLDRYLKVPYSFSKELPLFYRLFKRYPSLTFWMRHELGFKLNSLLWFMGADGKARLAGDWATFHYVFSDENTDPAGRFSESATVESTESVSHSDREDAQQIRIDTPCQVPYTPVTPPSKPRTVAEWLG